MLFVLLLNFLIAPLAYAQNLAKNFATPPAAARPWVYWFWLNGNITKAGIKADLEAMHRVGIGGVLIMEVDQGAPLGPVAFGSPQWRTLFRYVCTEAHRLGMQVNMTNDAGWCGSGGPWITPDLSMQKLVWTETPVEGPQHIEQDLPQPETVENYYQDVVVLAVPTPEDDGYRIPDIRGKSALDMQSFPPPAADVPVSDPKPVIDPAKIVNVTSRYQNGKLVWDVPAGKWTLLRFGHTSNGVENHPAPQSGLGLETDKLSKKATKAQFDGLMAHLTADNAGVVGKTLVTTHIDSWETGSQNWTPTFAADFARLRGYDPTPYLPVMTGRVVGSLDISERFLWDIRQTVSDLVVANYAGEMAKLAHQHGIRLSIEAYGSPTDDLAYGAAADEPMAEFWSVPKGSASETVPLMASAGHTGGHPIIGAEAFTATDGERWQLSPRDLKTLGDWAFGQGINRFVFHRYAMQPFLNVKPGMSMGPWGLHYERTETWWDQTKPWHNYLARCQYLLRQGVPVAQVCYLEPEGSPQEFSPPTLPPGLRADSISPDTLIARMTVKDGRLVLPDGVSYRVLVLPDTRTMTPRLLAKIAQLVKDGATVIGPSPVRSPSLSGFPDCDTQVRQMAKEVWGSNNGKSPRGNHYGKGYVIWGESPAQVLMRMDTLPDCSAPPFPAITWNHRHLPNGTDLYFIANLGHHASRVPVIFGIAGRIPQLWWPETGKRELAPEYAAERDNVTVTLTLDPAESVFVVFGPSKSTADHVTRLIRDEGGISSESVPIITRATYGVPGDASRTRDVRAKLGTLIMASGPEFQVAAMAEGDDPAYGVVKTLTVDYTLNGHQFHAKGQDPDTLDLSGPALPPAAVLIRGPEGGLRLRVNQPGTYEVSLASGKTITGQVTSIPVPRPLRESWSVTFPPHLGAPSQVKLAHLQSWSLNANAGVRNFSGTATYRTTFTLPAALLSQNQAFALDLGDVQVIADVTLNGKHLGILWKAPYRVDISSVLKPGVNTLEIKVTNLWINRMIGDESLPVDSDRNGDGTLKSWPQWVLGGKSSPTGRYTFTSWKLWGKDSPRPPSGLLGPVTISSAKDVPVTGP